MALDDGNYVFVCATNTSLALDITGGGDRAGSQLELWTADLLGRDAQVFHVSTDDSGYSMMYLPLTGKSLDVSGGTAAAGTSVIQWDDHGGDNQRWLIAEDGNTVTIDGVTYDTVKVSTKLSASLYIGAASTAKGKPCTLRSSGLRFAPVPVRSVPDGLYQIVSGIRRDVAVDVAGASKAAGANLQLWGLHGNNNQVFLFEEMTDGSERISACDTGHVVDAADARTQTPVKGNNALVWTWHGGDNQRWLVTGGVDLTRNGVTVPGYQISCKAGTNLALDACGASSKAGTNVWLWDRDTSHANLGQVWELRPAQAWGSDLECPADVLHDLGEHEPAPVIGASGAFSSQLSWVGSRGYWQARYRTRTRSAGMYPGARSAWSEWKCLLDGSASNGGWGEVGVDNCGAVRRDGRWWAKHPEESTPLAVTGTLGASGTDLVDVEYEVRRFTADWQGRGLPAHSGSASRVCTVAWAPTITVSAAELSPEGLAISQTMDWDRGGNLVTLQAVSGGYLLLDGWRGEDVASGEALTVPLEDLAFIPEDGEDIDLSWTIVTSDGVTTGGSATVELAYDDEYTTVAAPTVTEAEGWTKSVAFASVTSARLWVGTADGMAEVAGSGGAFTVPYPLGRDYGMVAVVETGGGWGIWRGSYTSANEPWYLFDLDNGVQAAIKCDIDEPARLSVRTAMDHDETLTTGGGLESVRVGSARSETVTVTGALAEFKDTDAAGSFRALKVCRFCWFRDPFGHLWRVAVTDASEDRNRRAYSEVSVSMRRVG